MATISVCITYYNRPASLRATLESLAGQTRQPNEVFLWDDCSPQPATEVAEAFAGRFKHFKFHRNSKNLGMPGNLNAVLGQASCDYVANLHDADVYHPHLLERWARVLDVSPEAGLVFCRDSRWANPVFVNDWKPEPSVLTPGREFFERFYLGRVDSIIWGTVMARREVYERLLPFDSKFKNWADVDMWMRFCGEGSIGLVPERLIELDQNPTHAGRFSFARMARGNQMVLDNIRRLFNEEEQAVAVSKQRRAWTNRWRRWMLGRLRRTEWRELREGWSFRRGELPGNYPKEGV